jgi:amphi-Trp domain-containing protein
MINLALLFGTGKIPRGRSLSKGGEPMSEKRDRDVEKVYSTSEFVAKLRRLADALETGERFEIQVAEERIYVPARAEFNVEHEREGNEEEIEFQLKWTNQ